VRAAGIPRPPWVTAAPARSASSDVVIMYRPGTVPAPMPETGACDCGSAGASGHSAQSASTGAARAITNRSDQSQHKPEWSEPPRTGAARPGLATTAGVCPKLVSGSAATLSRHRHGRGPRRQRFPGANGMNRRNRARARVAGYRPASAGGRPASAGCPAPAAAPGHLVAFGSTGSPGPAKPGTPGRTQLRRLANGESVGG